MVLALMAWSLMHGIAKLAISQHLPFSRTAARDFADKAAKILLSGMISVREGNELPGALLRSQPISD